MKILQIVSGLIEAGAGLALLAAPSTAMKLLFGSPLDSTAGLALGRLAGAALLALGVACLLAVADSKSRAARGLVVALLLYNLGAVAVLASAGFGGKALGELLWPAVGLHTVMTVWCVRALIGPGKNVPR